MLRLAPAIGYKNAASLLPIFHIRFCMESAIMSTLFLLAVCVLMAPEVIAGGNDSCYGSLGCFSNKAPWSDLLRPMPPPQTPEEIDTRFYLYTRNAPDRFSVQHPSDGVWSVAGSDFDGSRPTILMLHGICQSVNKTIFVQMKDALLKKVDANFLIADWGPGACGLNTYLQVCSNGRVVAASAAQFLKYLIANLGADVSRIHLIGNSLGGQIAGYVGKLIPNIARITALDASQEFFEGFDSRVRLHITDAVFIDAIHTNGAPVVPRLGFGLVAPVGHVDFFVNGGLRQPGCVHDDIPSNTSVTSLAEFGALTALVIDRLVWCSHERAPKIFVEDLAVSNCKFWGHKTNSIQRALSAATGGLSPLLWSPNCDKASCSAMGYDSIHFPARGSFDLLTSNAAPFCVPDTKADSAMAGAYVP